MDDIDIRVIHILIVGAFALANIIINASIFVYVYNNNRVLRKSTDTYVEFADAMVRIDNVARERGDALGLAICDTTENINKRLEHLTRWQKVTAKMIKEDLDILREHDKTVRQRYEEDKIDYNKS